MSSIRWQIWTLNRNEIDEKQSTLKNGTCILHWCWHTSSHQHMPLSHEHLAYIYERCTACTFKQKKAYIHLLRSVKDTQTLSWIWHDSRGMFLAPQFIAENYILLTLWLSVLLVKVFPAYRSVPLILFLFLKQKKNPMLTDCVIVGKGNPILLVSHISIKNVPLLERGFRPCGSTLQDQAPIACTTVTTVQQLTVLQLTLIILRLKTSN